MLRAVMENPTKPESVAAAVFQQRKRWIERTGGPAFPTNTVDAPGPTSGPQFIEPGMTLLDHFAGQALAGLCAFMGMILDNEGKTANSTPGIAKVAYEFAEAMLVEKKKREPK